MIKKRKAVAKAKRRLAVLIGRKARQRHIKRTKKVVARREMAEVNRLKREALNV